MWGIKTIMPARALTRATPRAGCGLTSPPQVNCHSNVFCCRANRVSCRIAPEDDHDWIVFSTELHGVRLVCDRSRGIPGSGEYFNDILLTFQRLNPDKSER